MIQEHSDPGASKEPMNPLWSRVYRFLSSLVCNDLNDPDPDHTKRTHQKTTTTTGQQK